MSSDNDTAFIESETCTLAFCDATGSLQFFIILAIPEVLIFSSNGIIAWTYINSMTVRQDPFNIYIFHLTLLYMLNGATLIPVIAIWIVWDYYFIASLLWNVVAVSVSKIAIFMTVLTVILMSLDRLQLVTDPIKYHRLKSKNNCLRKIYITWAIAVCATSSYGCSLYFMSTATVTINRLLLLSLVTTIDFIGPCVFLTVTNIAMFLKLKARIKSRREPSSSSCFDGISDSGNAGAVTFCNNDQSNESTDKHLETGVKRNSDDMAENYIHMSEGPQQACSSERYTVSHTEPPPFLATWSPLGGKIIKITKKTCKVEARRPEQVNDSLRKSTRTVRRLLMFVTSYLTFWLPVYVTLPLVYLSDVSFNVLASVLFILVVIDSVVTTLMYAMMSRKYRKELRKVMKGIWDLLNCQKN